MTDKKPMPDEIYEEMQQIADHFDAMLEEHKGQLGFKITRDDAILLRDWMRKAVGRKATFAPCAKDMGEYKPRHPGAIDEMDAEMTNEYEEALSALRKCFFNTASMGKCVDSFKAWSFVTHHEETIQRALTIAAKQGEKDRVMRVLVATLQTVESRTTPEMALRVNAALSQYEAMEEK